MAISMIKSLDKVTYENQYFNDKYNEIPKLEKEAFDAYEDYLFCDCDDVNEKEFRKDFFNLKIDRLILRKNQLTT